MKERPILFSGEMVCALLAGMKTQTRRVVKPMPPPVDAVTKLAGCDFSIFTDHHAAPDAYRVAGPVWAVRQIMGREPGWRCPYGAPGDRLWVRETWTMPTSALSIYYRADYPGGNRLLRPESPDYKSINAWAARYRVDRWHSPIHMPRWASRITLEVEAVRVERLHAITDEGARAEGVPHRKAFEHLWTEINGEPSWRSNPWVWVITFARSAS